MRIKFASSSRSMRVIKKGLVDSINAFIYPNSMVIYAKVIRKPSKFYYFLFTSTCKLNPFFFYSVLTMCVGNFHIKINLPHLLIRCCASIGGFGISFYIIQQACNDITTRQFTYVKRAYYIIICMYIFNSNKKLFC